MAETWTIELGTSAAGPKYISVEATVTDDSTDPPTLHIHRLKAALANEELKPKADIQASLVAKLQDMHRETLEAEAKIAADAAAMDTAWKTPLEVDLNAQEIP